LLDTGANRNLIDASVLSEKELASVNTTTRVAVANFQQGKEKLYSIGEVMIPVPYKGQDKVLKFLVMPSRSMNYNLIGVGDILGNFIPLLEELAKYRKIHGKVKHFQNEVNQAQTENIKEVDEGYMMEEEAVAYLETLSTPECLPEPEQKDVMDQEWFAKLWNLFPRLQAEKQNLQEDSRLPYKCKVELHEGARLFFAPVYQLSERFTSEMTRFLKDAEEKGILEKGETTCRSSAFMVARADPKAAQRMVVDFRKLNEMTLPKDANLPRMNQLPNHACRGGVMSKLDLTKGFYHVDVDEESRPLLGLYSICRS